jgi:hypothetical protein
MAKGIELSINFLVVFILSLAMFITGLMLLTDLFSKLDNIFKEISTESEKEILKQLMDKPFAIPQKGVTAPPKTAGVFYIGIRNDLGRDASFGFETQLSIATLDNGSVICEGDCPEFDSWILPVEPKLVKSYDSAVFDVPFRIPKARKGLYVFDILACDRTQGNCTRYDIQKKLHIIVK